MPIIFYDRKVKNGLTQEYKADIEEFANSESTPGDRLEKVTMDGVWSLRFNRAGRLLFAYFPYQREQHLLVLDILPNHEYDKSAYIKLSDYLKKILKDERGAIVREIERRKQQMALEAVAASSSSAVRYDYIPVHLGRDVLVFDEIQEQALILSKPLIIQGPPGSGKTSLALAFLIEGVVEKGFEKVLYVTESRKLQEQMEEDWESHPAYSDHQGKIEILTYEDLFKLNNPEFTWDVAQSKRIFNEWFSDYKKHPKNKDNKIILQASSATVYQEFRIVSGYEKEAYLAIGAKQSLFKEREDHEKIFEAYTAWLAHLEGNNITLCDFAKIPAREGCDRVVFDEAQDSSHGQLSQALDLSNNAEIVYLIDPRQSLTDNNPKLIYLKNLLMSRGKTLSEVVLPTNYRCPRKVTEFARVFDDLRIKLTPVSKTEARVLATNTEGHVEWIEPGNKGKEDFLRSLAGNADTYVVTLPEYVEEVKAKFGFSQVFTANTVKGLQCKHVVLYRVLDADIFRDANNALKNAGRIRDPKFSAPLAGCFVAGTRATDSVFFYQKKEHAVGYITIRLESVLSANSMSTAVPVSIKESTHEDWEKQAKKLLKESYDYIPIVKDILTKYSNMDAHEINAWITKNGEPVITERSSGVISAIPAAQAKQKEKKKSKQKSLPTPKELALDEFLVAKGEEHAQEESAKKGDVEKAVKSEEQTSSSICDAEGNYPLHLAILQQDIAFLNFLLDTFQGDVNVKNKHGHTPLHLAVKMDNLNLVNRLLEHKDIDVNARYEGGETPLYFAVNQGQLETVKVLLNIPFLDVNAQDNEGLAPLSLAFKDKRIEIAELLLHHSDCMINDSVYLAIKHHVFWLRAPDIVSKINWNHRHPLDGSTPLMWLCQDVSQLTPLGSGARDAVMEYTIRYNSIKTAIKMGGNTREKDNQNRTALFFACFLSNIGAMSAFLERDDYEANFTDTFENLPWKMREFLLKKMEEMKTAAFLFNVRTKLDAIIVAQQPTLVLADLFALKNPVEFERRVKIFGDINQEVFPNGYTLLSYACYKNVAAEKVQILLKMRNINVAHVDKQGGSALQLAFSQGYLETVRLLLLMPNINFSYLTEQIGIRQFSPIDWNYRSKTDNSTPLMWICKIQCGTEQAKKNKDSLAISLIRNVAVDITLRDHQGRTALFYAAESNSAGIITFFVGHYEDNFQLSFNKLSKGDIETFFKNLWNASAFLRRTKDFVAADDLDKIILTQ